MTLKLNDMNYTWKFSLVLLVSATLMACGGSSSKDDKGKVTDLRVKLEKLKKDKSKVDDDIRKLEEEILKADPKAAEQVQKLVSVDTVRAQDFSHYIDLQGKVDAENIAYVAPRGMGGQVKAIYVKTGQRIGKGQLVMKLDDAIARQGMVAAQQQIGGIKAQVAQAQSILERQQNLWKQNIGTEIQVLNAKTNVETLQSQLRAAEANVRLQQEQVGLSNVYSEISGVVETMNVRVGEFFSPQTAASPMSGIMIVNNSNLKIVTQVPENYVARVKQGDKVQVVVPETGKPAFQTTISTVGASIDEKTRSFRTEAKLPSDPLLKPNQTASMKILDYAAKGVIAVPINIVQSDEKNKYIYIMERTGDKTVARKRVVTVGEAYGGTIEIRSGLTGGEMIITDGYQSVYDGQNITTGK
jgi:membrane fusion protein (multidrug efflux system)